MPNDYVNLKNLQGAEIKPITDLAAINLTEVNGIAVEGNTIGIQDGYIESAYYTEMVDPTVGPAASSSAYVEGGTIYTLLGGYAVTSAINTASPSQQKVPSEAAVVSAFDDIVVSGASYYAGTGINIDAGHTVSVANVPTSAVAGLDTQLTGISASVAGKQDAISAGYRMELSGTTLSQARYFPIESPTSATITLQAGHAYKIQATAGSKTLTAETIPANQFGLEGHAEIFIANTGLIKTTSSVVLANPLEPDAVNNCTVRFHDGYAIISVEDHIAGHVVTVNAPSGTNTLNYWLGLANTSDASTQYIAVTASLNGQILNLNNAVTNGEKHVVGNGYADTVISGGISCTSKTTFANLAVGDIALLGGTLALGDVFVSSGATVSATGGDIVVENMKGNGVIDLSNSRRLYIPSGGTAYVSGVTLTKGYAKPTGGNWDRFGQLMFVDSTQKLVASGVSFVSNGSTGASAGGKTIYVYNGGVFELTNCTFLDNKYGAIDSVNGNILIQDCVFGPTQSIYAIGGTPKTSIVGSNQFLATFTGTNGGSAFVIISSGAILDFTGNTNAVVFNSVGKIIVSEGCTVINSGGTSVAIAGGTYTKINNDGTTA